MRRNASTIVLVVILVVILAVLPSGPATAAPCWLPPVIGSVADPFREPPCPYCAGNRGIEYAVASRTTVRAVAAGVVTWSGSVAGTTYVVVQHANGWRATYGKLATTTLSRGDRVISRSRVGTASGDFYFGLRRRDTYVDPAPFLGRREGRPRLVPIDGSARRSPPMSRLRCG